jgi:hypothetical protein
MERVMIEKNTIKSQDSLIDCNNGKRSSETLIQTISKLETAIEELERTKKQLVIAITALEAYTKKIYIVVNDSKVETVDYADGGEMAEKALKQIRELNK